MNQPFDRGAEDLGNSIHLEHVNVQVPDQRLATLFYVAGLGLTRDPYLMVSDSNMWVNVGRSQFHLPSGEAQVLRGHTGIVISGRKALLERLASVAKKLDGTAFAFSEHNGDGTVARVKMGKDQYLQFRETDRPQPDYDGHHVQMYITNFSGPYRRLQERELIYSEDNQYQYRFRDIVDPADGRHLFTIEHEVRSATHPMYLRPLINRNPAQTNRTYAHDHDQWLWAMGPDEYDR